MDTGGKRLNGLLAAIALAAVMAYVLLPDKSTHIGENPCARAVST
jgi:hypothetical protein